MQRLPPRSSISLIWAVLAACEMPSTPDPIAVSMTPVVLATEQEYATWPSSPLVAGGETIEIRGLALAGCGSLVAAASRRDWTIEFTITSVGDRDPCPLSKWAWEPFDARIRGLPHGEYRVRASVVGHGRKVVSGVQVTKG